MLILKERSDLTLTLFVRDFTPFKAEIWLWGHLTGFDEKKNLAVTEYIQFMTYTVCHHRRVIEIISLLQLFSIDVSVC